jgi:prepilin-type N-terminal cleavage/methylation domain-containing protein
MIAVPHRESGDNEAGFSLIELMVVTVLLTIVIVATLSTMWSIQRSEAYTRGRTAAMDNMRISLNRISKDLRQAGDFNATPTPNHLDVDTYINGAAHRVVYDVNAGTLTRQLDGGAAVIMHKELTEDDIFQYPEDDLDTPDTILIQMVVKPSNLPDTRLTLSSEVQLRNR